MATTRGATYGAWYTVAFLALLYALSFVDRMMLPLIAQPIIKSMGLSDTQMGLLIGAGFSVVYAIAGLPIAAIIDRGNRRNIIVIGVAFWSAMTVASGFAPNLSMLLLCRCGVALGEAVLTPAAISLIADLFPIKKRALPTAIYGATASIAGVGSLLIGSLVLALGTNVAHHFDMEPWRMALLIVGFPGIVMALIFYVTTHEPANKRGAPAKGTYVASFAVLWVQLKCGGHFYALFYFGLTLAGIVNLATLAWLPTILVRSLHQTPKEIGFQLGAVGAISGLICATFWAVFIPRVSSIYQLRAIILGLALTSVLGGSCIAYVVSVSYDFKAIVALFCGMIAITSLGILPPLAIQQLDAAPYRARLVSLYLLNTYLIGYTAGPVIVVWLTNLISPAENLGIGLAWLAVVFGSCAGMAFWRCAAALPRPARAEAGAAPHSCA